MNDIFGKIGKVDPSLCTCHSGGASGSDTVWEESLDRYGGKTRSYSYKTKFHIGSNKVEISDEDYQEGIKEVHKANQFMKRHGISKYMNLMARNWVQVKYSNQILAIGNLIRIGETNTKGYYNKGKCTVVDGGTGFAVMMGIINQKPVFVFDQGEEQWYKWSYNVSDYIKMDSSDVYLADQNFTGIGTRGINESGVKAIEQVLVNSL
tara:strand:- start:10170 stop:10790 length:621 start_codon:yes stop_codon:yes gene_type:complete